MQQRTIALEQLDLDPKNPRLPEDIAPDQDYLLRYVLEHGSLRELADSFLDNGYFEAERLIVIESDETEGRFIVVEGNRRLAALRILHGELGDVGLASREPSPEDLARLKEIPCLVVRDRDEVEEYLAYRHIGGMKTWSAEARARFTRRLVDKEADRGEADPFRAVGRQVGSNAQGIRNSYLAIGVLEHARDQLSLSTDFLQFERFGVWLRCMNSADIRAYIAVDSPKSYEEAVNAIAAVKSVRLEEVVGDLSVRSEGRRPLLADSRDITVYGYILQDPVAREALRRHEDFEIARQIVERRSVVLRLDRLASSVTSLSEELSVPGGLELHPDLLPQAERLFGAARSLRAIVKDLIDNDD